MKRTALILGCLLLATPVLAQAPAEKAGTSTQTSRVTQDFVTQAATSDLFELASAKLAQSRGSQAVKDFANQMVADHGKTSSELKRMVVGGGSKIEVPSQLDAAHQTKLDRLNDARGDDFSALYAAQQVEAHKTAVSLFEGYAAKGDQADLKDWAGKTVPALKHHLEMAQKLDAQRGTAPTVGTSAK